MVHRQKSCGRNYCTFAYNQWLKTRNNFLEVILTQMFVFRGCRPSENCGITWNRIQLKRAFGNAVADPTGKCGPIIEISMN